MGAYGIRVISIWPLYLKTAMTDDLDIGTTRSLGISLTANDVADAIMAAVEPWALRRVLPQVHFPVSVQTKAPLATCHNWANRQLQKRLAHF